MTERSKWNTVKVIKIRGVIRLSPIFVSWIGCSCVAKMNPPNSFRPGFYKLAHSRRFRKIDNLSYIYRRPTKKILLPNIFERPTRIIEIVYTRTIEVTADSIFRRPTRRIAVRNVFQRPTRKIPMPNIYSRPTRPIRRPFDCNNNITGEVPGADHAIQVQANAFNIRPCSIVLEWLNPELVYHL